METRRASAQHFAQDQQAILAIQQQIQDGNLDAARASIATAMKSYPADGGIENLLGVVEIQQGHADAARSAFNTAIRLTPRLVAAYLNLCRLDMASAETDKAAREEALRVIVKALALDPTNDEAHYDAATIYAWNGEPRLSLAQLNHLSLKARAQVGAQALFCSDYAAIGSHADADKAATALAASPDLTEEDADTCLPALRTAHRADLIESLYTAALNRAQLTPVGTRILGLAQEAEGKRAAARATLEAAFAADSRSVAVLEDLTRVAAADGDNEGALGYLAHARDLVPTNAELPYEFAVICLRMGLFAEARKALGQALQIDPDNPQYNLGMGLVVSFSDDPSQSLPYLNRYHELRPSDVQGVLALGEANFRARDYDQAAKWLQLAAANNSTSADARYYLGRIARQQGRFDDATAELKQSLSLRPKQADALAELGQIQVQNHNYSQAQNYFDEALQSDPESYAANFGLLQLYARTGDPRREAQSKRFDQLKDEKETRALQMMRVIELRPDQDSGPAPHPAATQN